MLVVSSVIGVGIFFTPGGVAKNLPNATWFFAAWIVGGLLALAGALANAVLLALVVLGPIVGHTKAAQEPFGGGGDVSLSAFGAAMSPVIFSYLGWNASTYVAGEIKEPGRNLPRSLFIGLGVCTAIYFFVMWTYVYALGMPGLAATAAKDAVPGGFQLGGVLFGAKGGQVI